MTLYATRADLAAHPAFASLETDGADNPCVWQNHYSCECCTHGDAHWADWWSSQCNDECPYCGAETEPHESAWIGPDEPELRALWEGLSEA